ncbi:nuclear receptor 2C2-associated protein [Ischnura elegans]|uniref:nuclear receptor 2C2-associated protein n=1 Tax=Ischnura elegans TaxID=197161 RepID=UPI001ED8894F|nr:nuclear receptor 2C2-associated protein [Ischnura elegans]
MSILDECGYKCRISSVLNRDIKSYGKSHLFDGNDDTCWNSDQGSPQWISIELQHRAHLTAFEIQFQGGFVGVNCSLELKDDGESISTTEDFYPEDVNSLQRFSLKNPRTAKEVKLVFNQSTDFYGRIVVYKLDVLGSKI